MNLKRRIIKSDKKVCLECQCYIKNCQATCSGLNRFRVGTSFRPPKVGSYKWKLISKLIRKNQCEEKETPFDVVGSASFSRNTWTYYTAKYTIAKTRPSKMLRERGYLEYRIGR